MYGLPVDVGWMWDGLPVDVDGLPVDVKRFDIPCKKGPGWALWVVPVLVLVLVLVHS